LLLLGFGAVILKKMQTSKIKEQNYKSKFKDF